MLFSDGKKTILLAPLRTPREKCLFFGLKKCFSGSLETSNTPKTTAKTLF